MVYKNSTPVANIGGVDLYMNDIVDACLIGKLNLFLQGDTGSGKTQLATDAMSYFPDKSLFILGRNDMDTRELFQQLNPDFFRALKEGKLEKGVAPKELTSKINTNLIVVDELPNCVPAVRAQLFNLFDGYVEINGIACPIGKGYSAGIATGNIGQKFTESTNELGRALKDRMHVILDTDYFAPNASDTQKILAGNTNPRVEFSAPEDKSADIVQRADELKKRPISFEKLMIANYLLHGLAYCEVGKKEQDKRKMKDAWPNAVDNHGAGSLDAMVLPVSVRGAKSIIRLSESLEDIARARGAENLEALESMMQAYKLVSAYSGVLNDVAVNANYSGDRYSAMDAIASAISAQFVEKAEALAKGLDMVGRGKTDEKILNLFTGRWKFMQDSLKGLVEEQKKSKG